ncbi:Neutral/alkaline non-lysosomal ceramidase [Anatilimnocola aggregata]|uniref:Neutral/alkaline non-lysosomal ceramidase n=1 Tax=Anatilimnocola aggregata TaxID=2528021 RepID=A0A517YLT7_9BACT|nr:neutral/alkaline non-lysosomal ceramidase N-terminal domain-containing protein [Anatilimnocola aggregata]QDU31189.1 Neutral/alkaline non-lysosomal ceramidase [Anatilimnocola aggregata]
MSWHHCLCSLALSLLLTLVVPQSILAADSWQAGLAKVNITPTKSMWMAGYGARNKPSEGKLTDLWAKAIVLQDASGHRALAITLDLVGIDRILSQSICQRIEKEHRLKRDQVALFCSHTHSGPVVSKNLRPMHEYLLPADQKELIAEYAQKLEDQLVELAGAAVKDIQPAKLSWASGKATFAVNRRTNKEAEVPQLRADGKILGPSDHDAPVLAVHNEQGELRGLLFGYACHATVLSGYDWCGDWPGYAQLELEQRHPGCLALFWAGCGADQNPLPRRTVALAEDYGRQMADAVDATLKQAGTPLTGSLKTTYRELAAPLGTLPTKEDLQTAADGKDKYQAARAKMLLADMAAGKALRSDYPYPVAVWQLGPDVQWVILGGEVVIDYALRLKSDLRGTKTWVAGYANDVMAYIPSRRVLIEGGYEGGGSMVYYGLPTIWAPEIEESIVKEVLQQAKTP